MVVAMAVGGTMVEAFDSLGRANRIQKREPTTGVEPVTYALPRRRSTT